MAVIWAVLRSSGLKDTYSAQRRGLVFLFSYGNNSFTGKVLKVQVQINRERLYGTAPGIVPKVTLRSLHGPPL